MKTFITSMAVAMLLAVTANADVVVLDGTASPTPAFTFNAFDTSPPVITGDGIQLAIPAGATENFGGIGFRAPDGLAAAPDMTGITEILVTLRADAGNISDLILAIREDEGGVVDAGEFFSFAIPATSFSGGGFVEVSVDPTSFVFNGSGGVQGATGVLDGDLFEVGLQTPFGGNNPLNVTVQQVQLVVPSAVPEPSTAGLLLAGLMGLCSVRRRKS